MLYYIYNRFYVVIGIGIVFVLVFVFIGLYYNVIIGYCFFYFFVLMLDFLFWVEEL